MSGRADFQTLFAILQLAHLIAVGLQNQGFIHIPARNIAKGLGQQNECDIQSCLPTYVQSAHKTKLLNGPLQMSLRNLA